jgi:hypothetical protein
MNDESFLGAVEENGVTRRRPDNDAMTSSDGAHRQRLTDLRVPKRSATR